jgi:zinc protease
VKRSLFLLSSLTLLVACADTTPPPVAPPPPAPVVAPPPAPVAVADPAPVTEGNVTVAFVRGMQVVVKRTPGAEFVAADLAIRGGVRNWTADNAGIEDVALGVATSGGTQSLAKGPFAQKLASLGADIDSHAGPDFSTIATKAPKASWDDLFPLFVDTFLAPALPASEFEVVKQRALAGRHHEQEDGDGRLQLLMRKALFTGHPYANRSDGTVETLSALKASDLAPQLAKLRDTARLVLIVVGDVDPAHVLDQVKTAFASVPHGSYVDTPLPPLHFTAPSFLGDPFKIPTNYIETAFSGPTWSDPDFATMRLGMFLLSERVFDEVRTKRNLSYAPSARFETGRTTPYGFLYVTAVDPNAAMKVMMDEARRLQNEPVPAKELAGVKSLFVSRDFQKHEPVDGQAGDLENAILLGGDWHVAKSVVDGVRATTPEALQAAAKKWIVGLQTSIVGDPGKLDPKIVSQ